MSPAASVVRWVLSFKEDIRASYDELKGVT